MSEGDRRCRHPVNKLFIFPQTCLPNRDEFFHLNRNKTARTHTHNYEGPKKYGSISQIRTGGQSEEQSKIEVITLLDQLSCQLVNSNQYSTTLLMILCNTYPCQTAAPPTCHHHRSEFVTLICPHSTWYDATINLQCQLAPVAVMSRGGICAMCVNVGIVDA